VVLLLNHFWSDPEYPWWAYALLGLVALGLLWLFYVCFFCVCELVIDDRGLRRQIMGWVLVSLDWREVQVIRAFWVTVNGVKKRGFTILPKQSTVHSAFRMRRIYFSETKNDDVCALLSEKGQLCGIRLEQRAEMFSPFEVVPRFSLR
jgi:hypothetical protein